MFITRTCFHDVLKSEFIGLRPLMHKLCSLFNNVTFHCSVLMQHIQLNAKYEISFHVLFFQNPIFKAGWNVSDKEWEAGPR